MGEFRGRDQLFLGDMDQGCSNIGLLSHSVGGAST